MFFFRFQLRFGFFKVFEHVSKEVPASVDLLLLDFLLVSFGCFCEFRLQLVVLMWSVLLLILENLLGPSSSLCLSLKELKVNL